MTHTLKRIGFTSAVKIAAIISAAAAVAPVLILLMLNAIFKFWDVIFPPEMLGQVIVGLAIWGGLAGGISAGICVILYNIAAHYCGGITFELQARRPPRKSKDAVDID